MSAQKVNFGNKNSYCSCRNRTRKLSITSPAPNQRAIPAPSKVTMYTLNEAYMSPSFIQPILKPVLNIQTVFVDIAGEECSRRVFANTFVLHTRTTVSPCSSCDPMRLTEPHWKSSYLLLFSIFHKWTTKSWKFSFSCAVDRILLKIQLPTFVLDFS